MDAVTLMYEPYEGEPRVRDRYADRLAVMVVACAAGAAAIVSVMAHRLFRRV